MKVFSAALALASAALVAAQDFNTSAGFNLVIDSSNATLEGATLAACHSGAAIEQLCVAGAVGINSSVFYHNTTTYNNVTGHLTGPVFWNLLVNLDGVPTNESSGMSFFYSPTSNVALAELTPGTSGIYVGFDDEEKMFIGSTMDESTFQEGVRPNYTDPTPIYNWQICFNYNIGYYYQSLAWVTAGEPINPTCQSVNVTRKFI